MTDALQHVYRVRINAPAEKVWEALTSSDYTTKYWYGSAFQGELIPGAEYKLTTADGGRVFIHGKMVEVDPPRRLVQTYNTTWPPFDKEKETTLTWELTPAGEGTELTLTHADFEEGSAMYETLKQGWPQILDGLKVLLETGEPPTGSGGASA